MLRCHSCWERNILRSHNEALRSDNEKLSKALCIQGQGLEDVRRLLHDSNMSARDESGMPACGETHVEVLDPADPTCPQLTVPRTKRDSDISLPSTRASYGSHGQELPEASEQESESLPAARQPKAFLNRNDLVAWMHGEPLPTCAVASRRRRRQEEACGSHSNDSAKEPPGPAPCQEACSSEIEMNDDEEDLPGALRAAAGEGTSSPIEMPDPIDASKSASDAEKDPADLFHPACDVLPALLEYFSVRDLLAWRVTSKQTRSPEVLLRHVAELGRFDTSASIIAFCDAATRTTSRDSPPFPDDVECQKRFDCQVWCLMLAKSHLTHFAEDYVRQTVDNNLTQLFSHCLDSDERVRVAAHYVVQQHAVCGLGFVKELITDTLLSQMRDILTGTEIEATWKRIKMYMPHLDSLLRSLTQHQHREWMSLLVDVLRRLQSASARHRATRQNLVIDRLKLLWLADGDPNRTYEDEKRQLRAIVDSLNVGDRDYQKTKASLESLLFC
ncbi:AMT1-1 [Symbiodinium sp. CCMP2592]|nr:AMT1-1 [Symbiodinium sp. CCMP2592]